VLSATSIWQEVFSGGSTSNLVEWADPEATNSIRRYYRFGIKP